MEYNLKHFAYIGDCVWELFIRQNVIQKTKMQALAHKLTTKYVCASFQASAIENIFNNLNEQEKELQRRGRNLKITINKRSKPQMHALATSFEVIVGYLYLNDKKRLEEIFELLKPMLSEIMN